jgi:hypothetical protein
MVNRSVVRQIPQFATLAILETLGSGLVVLAMPLIGAANPKSEPASFIPPKSGVPTDTRSGASRGNAACFPNQHEDSLSLMPLVPPSSHGLTRLSHPSFFVYLPSTSAHEVFFSLKDDQQQIHYQTKIKIVGREGILRIPLPKTASPLEVGKRYQWAASLLCSERLAPDSPFVMGWVERTRNLPVKEIKSTFKTPRKVSPIESKVDDYYAHGIWYDTLEHLATLKQQQPHDTDLVSSWQDLLDSIGLGAIAAAPLLSQP